MRVITVNVNGVRAAARKGGFAELLASRADIVCLQEVRSSATQLIKVLVEEGFGDTAVAFAPCEAPGRNGVAIVSRFPLLESRPVLPGFDHHGRWIEAVVDTPAGPLRVVSAYVPKGHADDPRQERKFTFLEAMDRRMTELRQAPTLVMGDINVAHTEGDLRNWKDRIGKSGFLESERAYLDAWTGSGWVDLGRALGGPGPGPYTWWSQRGRAFDNDAGWRIDYVWATPDLAARATDSEVMKATSWDSRWSDHAPLQVDFE